MNRSKIRRDIVAGFTALFALGLLALPEVAGGVRYPLKVSPNQRHLVDQDNQPVYIHGDTGWTLFCDIPLADAETYLENRRQKGFNTVNVQLVAAGWNQYDYSTRTPDGHLPFLKNLSGGAWDGLSQDPDLGTPNDAYFAWCDRIMAQASTKGMQLVIAPLWTGRSRSDWGKHILSNSLERCFAYGQYLGRRYRNRGNIIWCLQGDNNPGDDKTRYQEIAKGLRSAGVEHLITAHLERQYSARDFYEGESWLTLNSTYPHVETMVARSLLDYNRKPVMPSFMIEAWYEGEHQMTALQLRRQSYWSFCCGSAGQIFGNRPIYSYWEGWKTAMEGTGSVEQRHFKKLVGSRAWWKMSPDQDHAVVINSGGVYPATITAMHADDGETVIVYLPGGTLGPTVALNKVSGGAAKSWWFNPRTGDPALIGTYPTTLGNRTYPLPDTNDWVLVLDDATKNLPAPGTTVYGGTNAANAATLPVTLSANGRHLVDPNGAPFFLHGDTAWSLLVALNQEESERYLEDRRQRGFTAIMVNLIEHKFVASPPNNRNGDGPFLTPGDFSTPNEAYFRHADWVIERAEEKGIAVFLFPCYLGYGGGDEGFWKELNANGAHKSREYGRFLGARYQRFTNIIWVHGGDYSPPDDHPGVGFALEILLGIKERDPGKLHSFHGVRSSTSLEHARFAPHLQLNAVYTGDELGQGKATPDEPYKISLRAYNRSDFRPTFLIEARYESLTASSYGFTRTSERHRLRRQAYWAILSGTTGHFFGNEPVWSFRPGWDGPAGIGSPGNQDMPHLQQVFNSRAWHALVPDQDHTTVTARYGSFGQTDYVTAGRAADGSLVMVYVPPTGRETRALTVDLSRLSGELAARWFNPANGSYAVIPGSPFTNSGPRDFTTPGDNGTGQNDWVLVLESQSSQPPVTRTPSPLQFELRKVDAASPAYPWTKIAGDLDGDGRDNLIVAGQKGPLVWYHSPDFKKHTIADGGWNTVSGAVGDVDGDGDLDVLLGGSVWGENPGHLRAASGQPWKLHRIAEDPTHDIAAADFNGDGRLDAVTRNQSEFGAKSGNRIRIWLQQTNGPWQGEELECPHGEGLAVADLDRDGDPDIVIGGTWFETIREGGQVRWQAHGFAEFHRNATVAVADFNGDGRPDVALAPSELAGQHSRLSWFEAPENPRVGSWRGHWLADPIEAVVHSLAAADFDRDGRMDIAFAEMHQGADPDAVGIFLNRGAGHPWEKVVVSTTGSHGLQILDVDGDGAPDLFGANWSGPRQTVELWRQRTGPAAEASRDGSDGTAFSGLPRLRVSENRRFLVTADGRPFFWLADTAWWIRQLPPPLVKHYLSTRTQQGFNVIQVHCGLAVTNYAGASPFLNNAPESPHELFWRELDRVVAEARAHRLSVALVPMWGDEYGRAFGTNAARAFAFGQVFNNTVIENTHVVWIVSGEYDAINDYKVPVSAAQRGVLNAAARGLRAAHQGTQLMTIHPGVARTSSTDFHQEPWLDLNLLQSGHLIDSTAHRLPENHTLIANDYARDPIKPVLDGEPIYEDTPDAVWKVKHVEGPRAGPDAVRRKAYGSVFSGACGHTYGHNDVYGFFTPAFAGQVLSLKTRPSGPGQRGDWRDALRAPGATQMQHLRRLIESRPWLTQVPDPSLLATPETSPLEHLAALRGEGCALVYTPTGKPFRVRLDKLKGREVQAWWFDPRTGESQAVGRFAREGEREFTPPGQPGAGNDWVLALDDPATKLPAPGSARFEP